MSDTDPAPGYDGPTDPAAVMALNPAAAPRALAAMAIHGTDRERWAAAVHPNTPPQILHLLSQHPHLADKVAANPGAAPTTLTILLTADLRLLPHVLGNPACPVHLLREHHTHPAPLVRALIARHHRCPQDLLEGLGMDPEDFVRAAAIANPACPAHARVTAGLLGTAGGPDPVG